MADTDEQRDERAQRDSDDVLQEEIEVRLDDRAARLKHCLAALRTAGVPLDCVTASVLDELGAYIRTIIHEVLDEED